MIAVVPGRGLQAVIGTIPAVFVVAFVGVIAFVALFLDTSRRQYALDLVDRMVDMAAVLMGSPRKPIPVDPVMSAPGNDLGRRLPRSRTASAADRQLGAAPQRA